MSFQPTNHKNTLFESMPKDWKTSSIGNSYLKGRIGWQGLTTKEYLDDGEYLLVTGTDFSNGKVMWDTCHFVEKKRFSQDVKIQIANEDVLVTKDGTIGKIAYVDKVPMPATLNSGVFVIRPLNNEYIPKYLYYVLRSFLFDKFIENLSAGSTIKHLYQKDFVNFIFPLPDENEQKNIILAFETIDQALNETELLIRKYKNILQGLMQDLFKFGIDENGQIRSEETHKFKDSPLGRIPSDWEVKSVDELASYIGSGITPKGGQDVYITEGVKFIRSQNVHFQKLLLDDVAYIDNKTHLKMKRSEIIFNDVLLNITGASIGRCCVVPEYFGAANVNQHVCAIRLKDSNRYKSLFLSYFISTSDGQNQIEILNAGSNRQGLNYQQVRALKVVWPKDKEIEKIIPLLLKAEKAIESEAIYKSKLVSIKAGMIQDLITGKVRTNILSN